MLQLSKSIVKGTLIDLMQFFRFLKVRFQLADPDAEFDTISIDDVDLKVIKQVTLPDIYAFLSYATSKRSNIDSTRKRKTAAIKNLYHYLTTVIDTKMDDRSSSLVLWIGELFRLSKR